VKIDAQATWIHHAPREYNAFAYVMNGEASVGTGGTDDVILSKQDYVIFGKDGDKVEVTNTHGSDTLELVYLDGNPLNEPMAHQGPFVMNTQQELREAFVDLRAGTFGEMEDL